MISYLKCKNHTTLEIMQTCFWRNKDQRFLMLVMLHYDCIAATSSSVIQFFECLFFVVLSYASSLLFHFSNVFFIHWEECGLHERPSPVDMCCPNNPLLGVFIHLYLSKLSSLSLLSAHILKGQNRNLFFRWATFP